MTLVSTIETFSFISRSEQHGIIFTLEIYPPSVVPVSFGLRGAAAFSSCFSVCRSTNGATA